MLAPWQLIGKALGFETRIFRLLLESWRSPRTGAESTFSVIDSTDWVNVVATDTEGNMIMIRQFRFGTARFTFEVPGGMVDPGELPIVTAERELYEESGYRAERIVELGYVEPNPAIFNNRVHMFWAQGCRLVGSQVLDAGEDIEVVPTPIVEVQRMLRTGEIDHALVCVALQRYELCVAGVLDVERRAASTRLNAAILGEKP